MVLEASHKIFREAGVEVERFLDGFQDVDVEEGLHRGLRESDVAFQTEVWIGVPYCPPTSLRDYGAAAFSRRRAEVGPPTLGARRNVQYIQGGCEVKVTAGLSFEGLDQPLRSAQRLVGAEGFEPSTFWSRTKRATSLRYAPKKTCQIERALYHTRKGPTVKGKSAFL